MLASVTTRLAVLNICQEKKFPGSENSRVQKTSIQNSNKLDLEIWIAFGGGRGRCIRNRNKPVLGGSHFLEPGTEG